MPVPPQAIVVKDRQAELARQWLRRRMNDEAVYSAAEGAMFVALGAATLAAFTAILLFVFFLVQLRGRTFLTWETAVFAVNQKAAVAACGLGAVSLSLIAARNRRWGGEGPGPVTGSPGEPEFRDVFATVFNLVGDFVCSGPCLIASAGGSFAKAKRLWSADAGELAMLILWLWEKGTKARVGEIFRRFPGLNTVQVLPLLRDIPGVTWLPDPRGIVLLEEDFRAALETALGVKWKAKADSTPGPEPEREPPLSGENAQIIGWYAALGLPPYATVQAVKKQYRRLAKKHHPDLSAGASAKDAAAHEDRMKRINIAYENIMKRSGR